MTLSAAGFLAALAAALLVALPAVPWTLRLALRRNLVDTPGGRKAHTTAVPRIGGIGIGCGYLAGVLAGAALPGAFDWNSRDTGILVGALAMFAIGLADDLYRPRTADGRQRDGLSAPVKLLLQLAAVALPVASGVSIDGLQIPGDGWITFPPLVSWVLSMVWIVAIINAVNFIDGLDGLAGGVSLIMAATIGTIAVWGPARSPSAAVHALALLGGIIGFLRLNFPPARIFMGDGGAYLLGYLLAVLAISAVMKTATLIAVMTPLLILALPILNLAGVVVVRVSAGRSPLSADREHLHHRLQDAGWNDLSVLLFVYAICGLCGSASLAVFGLSAPSAAFSGGVALLLVWVAARRSRPDRGEPPASG
ncbi:MAG: undecaprenyl/decaprenyl-phosphate alpha-N-acetylglucosaminyl 1-phosphate transferase [Fimbriimonadaceae bacterium]|nr:undecaprenyl/decaprenyl-phosphate alpha-N-acetylglucosaminyl 1-phosphate transferase [Fimbriimonadaceae bacterium]